MYIAYHHSETCMLVLPQRTMSTDMIYMEPFQSVYSVQTRMKWYNTMCRASVLAIVIALLPLFLSSFPPCLHSVYS